MRRSLLVLATLLLGCQTPVSLGETARLEVVVLQGFATPTAPLDQLGAEVTVLVDARSREALQRAATFVEALPAGVRPAAIASGPARRGEACRVGRALSAPTAAQMASRLETLATAESGSLSAALAAWSEDRRAEGTPERVVVFSAFEAEPEGCADLCATASSLAEQGVVLDWVAVGEGRAPACLADLPRPGGAGPIATALAPTPPTFQVRTGPGAVAGGPGALGDGLAAGRAGDTVTLLPGTVTVHFDLEPAEQVGPLDVEPGERLRLVLVDFPMAAPPHRSWWIERPGAEESPPVAPDPEPGARPPAPAPEPDAEASPPAIAPEAGPDVVLDAP